MIDDMTYLKLKSIKENINRFIGKLDEISLSLNYELNQEKRNFFTFISKHIIFFKYLYIGMRDMYFFKAIISDLYYYILSILKNEVRYMYLNERSIIENYTRAVVRKTVEEDHITENIFLKLKDMRFSFDFNEQSYSLIKSEYNISCGYIHGGNVLNDNLSFVFEECLKNNICVRKMNNYIERIMKIFKVYDKMLICQYGEYINGCFHREKTIFKYLLGKECYELLFEVIN